MSVTGKTALATELEKVSFHCNAKECSNYRTTALRPHASKVTLRIFKLGFSSTWAENLQMYNLGLEKAEEPEIKVHWIIEKAREFWKNIYFCFTDSAKGSDCG